MHDVHAEEEAEGEEGDLLEVHLECGHELLHSRRGGLHCEVGGRRADGRGESLLCEGVSNVEHVADARVVALVQ
eukprot:CAMPEP_0206036568 /NCGR_PEP_ID=MMETSP1466-20131121/2862_1 /ASSEMBLY_ACC=CAM_ASM_001126 /TAXON_ID=44452 /ORGANISM="Pavlova gyrans, Strain CCMP608" /LENGTH=73 /DNA_ID=CAMNT_0053411053 /DNA_START=183 /DNA_END=401 /DNA_ORIENTATION=+